MSNKKQRQFRLQDADYAFLKELGKGGNATKGLEYLVSQQRERVAEAKSAEQTINDNADAIGVALANIKSGE